MTHLTMTIVRDDETIYTCSALAGKDMGFGHKLWKLSDGREVTARNWQTVAKKMLEEGETP